MKFRVERDALAEAVAWTAKSLPNRPSVPVLAGVMLRVTDGNLQVSGLRRPLPRWPPSSPPGSPWRRPSYLPAWPCYRSV